jgi:transcriptional regulator with XRE-family HTH domain
MRRKEETFAQALARLRNANGWSRYRLWQESGVSQPSLGRLEKGAQSPSLATAQKIAKALGVEAIG